MPKMSNLKKHQTLPPPSWWEDSHLIGEISSIDTLTKLSENSTDYVRAAVAQNPNTPLNVLRTLACDSSYLVREGVAYNEKISELDDIANVLTHDKDRHVRLSLAHNNNTSSEILNKMATDTDRAVKEAISEHRNICIETLEKLAKDKDPIIRARVAGNPVVTQKIIAELAKEDNICVLMQLAGNYKTPPEILDKLAERGDCQISSAIANNPAASQRALMSSYRVLLSEPEAYLKYHAEICEIAGNPNTPKGILADLAINEDYTIRGCVALNPSAPPEVLEKLAGDEDEEIRYFIAKNHNTPPQILTGYAQSKETYVRMAVALNPNTPDKALRLLAEDPDSRVRFNVTHNSNVSFGTIDIMVKNEGVDCFIDPNQHYSDIDYFHDMLEKQ